MTEKEAETVNMAHDIIDLFRLVTDLDDMDVIRSVLKEAIKLLEEKERDETEKVFRQMSG